MKDYELWILIIGEEFWIILSDFKDSSIITTAVDEGHEKLRKQNNTRPNPLMDLKFGLVLKNLK